MKTNYSLINDEQQLDGARNRFGQALPTYDDGFGPIFIHRDSMGITALVRAQTWEDAYSICEDEFFPAADFDAIGEQARIDAMPEGKEQDHAIACWHEAYGHRGSFRKMPDGTTSFIYAKDLNGDRLDLVTPKLLKELEITLQISARE